MTLPSASTLTDEQLRVLCAEAEGYANAMPVNRVEGGRDVRGQLNGIERVAPDYLHDANAALRLLDKYQWWEALRDDGLVNGIAVIIYKEGEAVDHFMGAAPDFCRAIVLSFLRAEGKIL